MTLSERIARTCNTPGCGRATPSSEHGYCRDCIGPVLRTGQPPVIPEWRRRLTARDNTGQILGRAA